MQAPNIIAQVLERMMPVGSIVEWAPVDGGDTDLSTPAKVAAYYGFGTWEAYGSGQMLLGVSSSHAIGSTGGEENVTLALRQIPSHAHYERLDFSGFGVRNLAASPGTGEGSGKVFIAQDAGSSASEYYVQTDQAGGGQSHNNMPPYITIYRWRRIA